MYHVELINIKENDPFFAFCDDITNKAKNMFNVANFYIRNTMTGLKKDEASLTANETEVLNVVSESIKALNVKYADKGKSKQFTIPSTDKWFLGYNTLDGIFKVSENVDYRATHVHVSQHAIKECVESWKSYFKLNKLYAADPSAFNGKPRIPKYCKTDHKAAVLSNAAAYVKKGVLCIPYAKVKFDISNVPHASQDKLIEVRIVPYCGIYQLQIVTDDLIADIEVIEDIEIPSDAGIMAIDPGIDNFAAIVDNKGFAPIVIKGGYIKSLNQWYNKQIAKYKGIQMQGHDPELYHPSTTRKQHTLSRRRNARLRDFFYKTAHYICRLAQDHNIEYIVFGKNIGWKNSVDLGHKNNQEFTQIPHAKFLGILITVSRRYGITVITQEESYSSKASFLDNDDVPTYKSGEENNYVFSGNRVKRGLYKSKDGTIINADINGAANIIRKKDSNAFAGIDKSYTHATTQSVVYSKGKVSPVTGSRGRVSALCSAQAGMKPKCFSFG